MKIEIRSKANAVAQKAAMIFATEADGLTQRVGLDLEIAYDGGYS